MLPRTLPEVVAGPLALPQRMFFEDLAGSQERGFGVLVVQRAGRGVSFLRLLVVVHVYDFIFSHMS